MTHRFLLSLLLGLIVALGIGIAPGSIALAAEAGPGEGLVVFNRKSSMKGKAIRFNIEQDGRPIGQLLSGTTIEVPLAPGSPMCTLLGWVDSQPLPAVPNRRQYAHDHQRDSFRFGGICSRVRGAHVL